jgi:ADP-ribosylglycohydrolase
MNLKEKIRGLFLGVAIGDALGMPFESKPYDVVKKVKKRENYRSGRWKKAGSWTDDTQLTIATAKAILDAGDFNMDAIATSHIVAYKTSVAGWGSTTREACQRLEAGIPWTESGDFKGNERRGLGNGIPMKAAPLAAFFTLKQNFAGFTKNCVDFTAMTHQTSVAVSSCLAHVIALNECLRTTPEKFDTKLFLRRLIRASEVGRSYYSETLKDDITERFKGLLPLYESKSLYDDGHLVKEYGGGSCYVYDSLPISYAFFIRSPFNIQSMIDAAYVGGDADTNASLIGGLLGALNGEDIFPAHLKDGLDKKDDILNLADVFYEKFAHGILQSETS